MDYRRIGLRAAMFIVAISFLAGTMPVFAAAELGAASVVDLKARDPRTAGFFERGTGGPDAFGYTWIDSNEPGGPVYSWVDITTTGTPIAGMGDDDYDGPFALGMEFPFYGANQTQFYVGSNGFITFGMGDTTYINSCPLPDGYAEAVIAPMWDDMDPSATGDIARYQHFDSHAVFGNCTVIEYPNWHHYPGGSTLSGTFEVILMANGNIQMQYMDSGAELGSGSTTGIQSPDGTMGLTYACDTANSLTDNLAILFTVAENVYINPSLVEDTVCVNEEYEAVLTVTNMTSMADTYNVTYSSAWRISGPSSVGPIPAGGTAQITVMVTVEDATTETSTVTVTSQSNPMYTANADLVITGGTKFWVEGAPMTHVRMDDVAVSYNNMLYAIGGYSDVRGSVEIYDPANDTWTAGATYANLCEYTNAGALCNGHVFMMSDSTSTPGRLLFDYDLANNTWSTQALPSSNPNVPDLWAPGMVAFDGFVYVVGGATTPGGGNSPLCFKYAPATNTWTQIANLNHNRAFFAIWEHEGMIYVAGGNDGSTEMTHTEYYDSSTNTWTVNTTTFPNLPAGWWGMASAKVGDKLYLACGVKNQEITTDVYYFDFADHAWHQDMSAIQPVYRVAGAAIGENFYIIGGDAGGFNPQNFNQQMTTCSTENPCVNNGDVNQNGSVTAGDAQLAFSIALGAYTPTEAERCSADCNANGDVTAGDAQGIFATALGSGSCADPV